MQSAFKLHTNAAMKAPRIAAAPRPGAVETIQVRRDVWQEAQRQADGDPRRLQIISSRKVRILDSRYSPPR
jgi:hypothetical protein